MKTILLNGPPSVGKDYAARVIRQTFGRGRIAYLDRMSMPIKRAFAGMMNLYIGPEGIVEPWEARKEEIIPILGVSYRQWQIDFSERFMKNYGLDIFARLFLERLRPLRSLSPDGIMVVPDCGFDLEVRTLRDVMDMHDLLLIRLFREGCDFTGDSRGYISKNIPLLVSTEIRNNGTEEFDKELQELVERFLGS